MLEVRNVCVIKSLKPVCQDHSSPELVLKQCIILAVPPVSWLLPSVVECLLNHTPLNLPCNVVNNGVVPNRACQGQVNNHTPVCTVFPNRVCITDTTLHLQQCNNSNNNKWQWDVVECLPNNNPEEVDPCQVKTALNQAVFLPNNPVNVPVPPAVLQTVHLQQCLVQVNLPDVECHLNPTRILAEGCLLNLVGVLIVSTRLFVTVLAKMMERTWIQWQWDKCLHPWLHLLKCYRVD
jgi:hypothetical protein